MTTHAFDAAVTALSRNAWLPTGEEVALGKEFFLRRDGLDRRLLPGMPVCPDPQGWVTQHVLWLEDVVGIVDGLLAAWRGYLPDSHMVALLEAYAHQARPAVPYAADLLRAWEAEAFESCSPEEAGWWEEWHIPETERQALDALNQQLIPIGAMLVAAVDRGITAL
ncbi:hypothetical protein [Streptomyces sp. I05A-00742]|uniref:hypothetical protein n=1 Tax=Streptomyces sp. I05A-00742 TaxID=2732853 RepID=UPI001488E2FF|nr:hypothetical protein [Streptomyces sp. I05A-00742]